jgi:hypothetical protein
LAEQYVDARTGDTPPISSVICFLQLQPLLRLTSQHQSFQTLKGVIYVREQLAEKILDVEVNYARDMHLADTGNELREGTHYPMVDDNSMPKTEESRHAPDRSRLRQVRFAPRPPGDEGGGTELDDWFKKLRQAQKQAPGTAPAKPPLTLDDLPTQCRTGSRLRAEQAKRGSRRTQASKWAPDKQLVRARPRY